MLVSRVVAVLGVVWHGFLVAPVLHGFYADFGVGKLNRGASFGYKRIGISETLSVSYVPNESKPFLYSAFLM
jgi:hypothetical protein